MKSCSEQIRILQVTHGNISESELARRLNTTPQNLNQKMKRDNWTTGDLEQVAEALGCKLSIEFIEQNSRTD